MNRVRSSPGLRASTGPVRVVRAADRLLRTAGDGRLAIGLLLVAGIANAVAAAVPDGGRLLASAPYGVLLAAVVLSGVAGTALRVPAAWREWRSPAPQPDTRDVLRARVPLPAGWDRRARAALVGRLGRAGYVVRELPAGALAATRRGWSRFAALGTHLALVLVLVGAATSAAFVEEVTFSLLPGEQALVGRPGPGGDAAVRLERFDAAFGADGRPSRLDAHVTYLRAGAPVGTDLIRVNEPGDHDGRLIHGWTYGPAAGVRVTSLGGRVLLDGPVALAELRDGRPAAFADLPTAGVTLGLLLADGDANALLVTAAGPAGGVDAATLRPGESARLGDVEVELAELSAYVTFLARSDPGMVPLFAGAALLTAGLALGFWLPRRRVSIHELGDELELRLRGERFDRPSAELARLRRIVEAAP